MFLIISMVNTLSGGAFGRKLELDYIIEAIQVALACPGKPVKLTWSREEEFANDHECPEDLEVTVELGAGPR